MPYKCPVCKKHYRIKENYEAHLETHTVEPEEVTSAGNPEAGLNSPLEPSPASQLQEAFDHFNKQIQTLSENDQVLQDQVSKLMDNQFQAIQSVENPPQNWDVDWSFWKDMPEDLRKAGLKFMGDIGSAARGLAGAGDEDSDLELLKEIIKIDKEKTRERRVKRIEAVYQSIGDPDVEHYVVTPKKKEKPKIKKEDATKVG
jgi:hypothetical protein